jgi:DsbC/DsbD-like thiol-disulfide interchange protein
MKRNLLTLSTLLLLSLSGAACSSAGNVNDTNGANAANASPNANAQASTAKGLPDDVLRASAQRAEIQAGKSADAEVRLTIKEGYHINANPPSQYQIATQLTVPETEGVTAGQVSYPASITKKFEFSEQPLAVYEREALIKVPLKAAAGAARGERTIPARLRFQACDEQVCYPKKEIQVSLPVTVK